MYGVNQDNHLDRQFSVSWILHVRQDENDTGYLYYVDTGVWDQQSARSRAATHVVDQRPTAGTYYVELEASCDCTYIGKP
jgi:hypothetical protein